MDYPIILFGILSQLGHENASLFLRSSSVIPSLSLRSGNGLVSYLPNALSIVATSWRRTAS